MAQKGVLRNLAGGAFLCIRIRRRVVGKQEAEEPGSSEQVDVDQESTKDGASEESVTVFRLLDLPAELVLRVLELAVVHSSKADPICVTSALNPLVNCPKANPHRHRLVQPAIMGTCRMLRDEGLPMFYSQNVFRIPAHSERRITRWLGTLNEAHKAYITLSSPLSGPFPSLQHALYVLHDIVKVVSRQWPELKVVVNKDSTKIPLHFSKGDWACTMAFKERPGMRLESIDKMHQKIRQNFGNASFRAHFFLDLDTTDVVHRASLKAKGYIT